MQPDISVENERKIIPLGIQLLLYINLFIYIYDGFFGMPYRKQIGVIISIILALIIFFEYFKYIQIMELIIPLYFVLVLIYVRLFPYRGYTSFLKNIPYSLIGFSLTILIRHGKWPKYSFLLYSMLAFIPFAYSFFYVKIDIVNFQSSLHMNRNAIPMLLVITCSLLYMVETSSGKKWLSLFPALATLVFSFLSMSRTGLAIAIGMTFLVFMLNVKSILLDKNMRLTNKLTGAKKGSLWVAASVLFILLIILCVYFIMNSRFAIVGLHTSSRVEMIIEFFSELNTKNFIFGFRPEIVNRMSRIDNSYIMAFSYLGIGSVVFYGLLIYAVIAFIKYRAFLFLGLLLLQMVYGLAEFLSPLDIGDIVLIPLLVIGLSLGCKGTWLTNRLQSRKLYVVLTSRKK